MMLSFILERMCPPYGFPVYVEQVTREGTVVVVTPHRSEALIFQAIPVQCTEAHFVIEPLLHGSVWDHYQPMALCDPDDPAAPTVEMPVSIPVANSQVSADVTTYDPVVMTVPGEASARVILPTSSTSTLPNRLVGTSERLGFWDRWSFVGNWRGCIRHVVHKITG